MLSTKLAKTEFTILLLAFSALIPGLAFAQEDNYGLRLSAADWEYPNSSSWGGNYSPQTQINKDTVDQLEVKWLYPAGGMSLAPEGIRSARLGEGAVVPPIVKDGLVTIATNFNKIYTNDIKTGRLVWTYDYDIDYTKQTERLPLSPWGTHLHAIRYWDREDVIMVNGYVCDFFGVDHKTGEEKFHVVDTCLNVPGNKETYRANAAAINVQGTYERGNLFIHHNPGAVPGPSGGRANTMGIDMNTHQIKWRIYQYPPSPGEPDWALQECSIGWFASPQGPIACEEVAAVNRDALMYDWQWNPKLAEKGPWEIYADDTTPWSPSPYFNVGTSGIWGQPMIDEETGMLYVAQAQASPDGNGTFRPGPNLYATAAMGINMDTGTRIWWSQTNPHDLRDYDNNWGGMLKNIRLPDGTTEKVYIKGAKDGYLYAYDAETGEAVWWVNTIKEGPEKWGYFSQINGDLFDPKSWEDMTRPWLSYGDPLAEGRPWANAPTPQIPTKDNPIRVIPGWGNGAFATDLSFHDNTIFHWIKPSQRNIVAYRDASLRTSGSAWSSQRATEENYFGATLTARDAGTGKSKWHYWFPHGEVRGHIGITGGMVFAAFPDGLMRFLDEETGDVLHEITMGSGSVTGVTVGKDSDGNSHIFAVLNSIGANQPYGVGRSGASTIVAYGLAAAPPGVQTVTTTSTVARTTTVTSEVSAGLPATVTYAAVAIAVIAIIAAAVLATRRRP